MEGLHGMGLECVKPEGAFYAFPKVADETAAQKLIDNGVIVAPGTAFGEGGKGHIRLSYATSEDNIKKALVIMEKVLV